MTKNDLLIAGLLGIFVAAAIYVMPALYFGLGGVPKEAAALIARYPATTWQVYELTGDPGELPPWIYRVGDFAFVAKGLPATALEGNATARGSIPSLAFRTGASLAVMGLVLALLLPLIADRVDPARHTRFSLGFAAAATVFLIAAALVLVGAHRTAGMSPEAAALWRTFGDTAPLVLEVPGDPTTAVPQLDAPPVRLAAAGTVRTWVFFPPEEREAFLELAKAYGSSAHPVALESATRYLFLPVALLFLGLAAIWITYLADSPREPTIPVSAPEGA